MWTWRAGRVSVAVHRVNEGSMIRPDWQHLTPAEAAAWRLIKSWERRGTLVQQAYVAAHTN